MSDDNVIPFVKLEPWVEAQVHFMVNDLFMGFGEISHYLSAYYKIKVDPIILERHYERTKDKYF